MKFDSSSLSAKGGQMNVSLTPLVAIPASQAGSLSGFETRCSCGLIIRSSLRTLAEQDAAEHLRYHAKKQGGR
jgi:hypothetical protein